jgi:hypothetical protein
MPFREDVDLAKVLVNLGLGRILYIKGTIDKDQTP